MICTWYLALRTNNIRKTSKYYSWYLCQMSLQIMPLSILISIPVTQVIRVRITYGHCVIRTQRTECERSKATDRKWTVQVVYNLQCDLSDAGYVGYTRGHLHNRVKGHKQQSSAIAKHYKNVHGTIPQDPLKRFEVLKKRRNKFDCLVYEMLFIRTLKPNLKVQSDSIRANVFS